MGRIKTKLIKRLTGQFMKNYNTDMGVAFDQNKVIVREHLAGGSKKLRNAIAGYATRLKRRQAAEQA